ncbi:hypothetical protein [Paenibacillus hunanensis]|uniref:Uncharacterized protein n=1 Tax=Paenibacillus hunanensis TaxID=539262 RepID=A0ABU1IX72_9BACL|nr:hypothetical protein [Paenibacillus hunanensis]MDR6243526.1 hypothetical protein [Paenibacillus hunanensis]GGI98350.1 hypothetical protein GCM10008022_03900 [Paenibacillus hunanensis]
MIQIKTIEELNSLNVGNQIKAVGKFNKPYADNYHTRIEVYMKVIKNEAGSNTFAEINNNNTKWTALDIDRVADQVYLIKN